MVSKLIVVLCLLACFHPVYGQEGDKPYGHFKLKSKKDLIIILYTEMDAIRMDAGLPPSAYEPIEYAFIVDGNKVTAYQFVQGSYPYLLKPDKLSPKEIVKKIKISNTKEIAFLQKFKLKHSLEVTKRVNKDMQQESKSLVEFYSRNYITIYNIQSIENRYYFGRFDAPVNSRKNTPALIKDAVHLHQLFCQNFPVIETCKFCKKNYREKY